MITLAIQEKSIAKLNKEIELLFWPTDFCGQKTKNKILKQTYKSLKTCYAILAFIAIAGIIMFLVWKNNNNFFLCFKIYDNYFGKWSKVSNFIYFFTSIWLGFNGIRSPMLIVYSLINLRVQIHLLKQNISNMTKIFQTCDNTVYQKKINDNLLLCMSHHIMIKKYVKLCY